jgi:hypothetical protein
MATINIQLPVIDAEQSVEIEVKINGKSQRYHYRVEILKWEQCESKENKAECIKTMVSNYSKEWQLLQIGMPTEEEIPIMFKQSSRN